MTLENLIDKVELYRSDKLLIYRGTDSKSSRKYIVKNLLLPSARSESRLNHEYSILRKLEKVSGGIPKAIEVVHGNLVFADMKGVSLDHLISKNILMLDDKIEILCQLTQVISQVHQGGVIHLDIKPSNILWDSDLKKLTLIDFGIATELKTSRISNTTGIETLVGTLAYMAPEQTGRLNRHIDYRSDYYSLGITAFELMTSKKPFEANDAIGWVHCHIAQTPLLAHLVDPACPEILSRIIGKLIEKNAEDRYQSSYGLRIDFEQCQQRLRLNAAILPFPLGQKDISEQLLIPEKLYGRSKEVETLLETFDGACIERTCRLLFVQGESGIGKTALIQEVYRPLIARSGYFCTGKYDLLQRDVPYLGINQALTSLVHQVLMEPVARQQEWVNSFQTQLADDAWILTEIVPDIALLLNVTDGNSNIDTVAKQKRLIRSVGRFFKVFADAHTPVVMFIDDLQWADPSSLYLLEEVFKTSFEELGSLLTVGAFRSDEVTAEHSLSFSVRRIAETGVKISTIKLNPLNQEHLREILRDTLNRTENEIAPLAEILFYKTNGHPLFYHQFIRVLAEKELLVFDAEQGYWTWETDKIRQLDATDNVASLMIEKIRDLGTNEQDLLQQAACLGNRFNLKVLSISIGLRVHDLYQDLATHVKQGVLFTLQAAYPVYSPEDLENLEYKFLHDKVQQAAYENIPECSRGRIHFQIGTNLWQYFKMDGNENWIFLIANQLGVGRNVAQSKAEINTLLDAFLKAAKRARSTLAQSLSRQYLDWGFALFTKDSWQDDYARTLEYHHLALDVAFHLKDFDRVESLYQSVLTHARDLLDQVSAHRVKIDALIAINEPRKAIDVSLNVMRSLGVHFPKKWHTLFALKELVRFKFELGRKLDGRAMLPDCSLKDPNIIAALKLLNQVAPVFVTTRPDLSRSAGVIFPRLTIKYGLGDEAAFGFSLLGLQFAILVDYKRAKVFSDLSMDLAGKIKNKGHRARVYHGVAYALHHWQASLDESVEIERSVVNLCQEVCDPEWAAHGASWLIIYTFLKGESLAVLPSKIDEMAPIMAMTPHVMLLYQIYYQTIINLKGQGPEPWILKGDKFNEDIFLRRDTAERGASLTAHFNLQKLILAYLFNKSNTAQEYAVKALVSYKKYQATYNYTLAVFYGALSDLEIYPQLNPWQKLSARKNIRKAIKLYRIWTKHAPVNFSHKYDLLRAEFARLRRRFEPARSFYEQAIHSAEKNGFIQEEALAWELAARFHLKNGQTVIGRELLEQARDRYQKWGALAKVGDLQEVYPEILRQPSKTVSLDIPHVPGQVHTLTHPTMTNRTTHQALDLESIFKATRLMTGHLTLNALLESLISIMVENSGATKGALILKHRNNNDFRLRLRTASDKCISEDMALDEVQDLPVSLIQYTIKTEKLYLLGSGSLSLVHKDRYFQQNRPASLLVLPLRNEEKLLGVIYLENTRTTRAFTAHRIEICNFLAAQAAINLQKAELYESLKYSLHAEQLTLQREQLANRNLEQLRNQLEEKVEEQTAHLEEQKALLIKQKEQLIAADEIKTRFFQNISHELRTPLTLIINPLLNLKQQYENETDFQICLRNSQRLLNLVNQLLDLQKLQSGKQQMELCPLDLCELLKACAECFEPSCKNRDIVFKYELTIAAEPCYIMGNQDALEKIVFNYLANALKYSPRAGTINLALSDQGNDWLITVRDNGPGIPKDKQGKLFQMFSQVDEGSTNKQNGTGLGLALVKDLAEMQKGQVGVNSEEGRGCSFWVTFPKTQKPKPKLDLLFVDDNVNLLKELARSIIDEEKSYRLEMTTCVQDAKNILDSHEVLCLVTDAHMPGTDGTELLAYVMETQPNCRRFLVTGQENPEIFKRAINLGRIERIFTKPFILRDLFEVIDEIVGSQPQEVRKSDEIVPARLHHFVEQQKVLDLMHEENVINEEERHASPMFHADEQQMEHSPNRGAIVLASEATVLVVDDNTDMRNLIGSILEKAQYRVFLATDGLSGFQLAKAHVPDLIITDWMMPRISGIELLEKIRNDLTLASVPTIVLTAKGDQESKMSGTKAGASAYLSKPFDKQELLCTVSNLINLKQRERQVVELSRQIEENVLKRFLPPDLVNAIVSGDLDLNAKPQVKLLTVLFADICQFTTISEQLGPSGVAEVLNSYLDAMTEIIFEHGGTVDKFVGDGVMVFFGAPTKLAAEDQIAKAVSCAEAMQKAMKALNENWLEKHQLSEEMKIRIGIHHGPAVVGAFGGKKRSDYTAIGPTINLASRIQNLALPGEVFVTSTVRDFLPSDSWQLVGTFDIKGCNVKQNVFRLILKADFKVVA